jgi:mono/diheme cytochrome c family protein
MNTPQPRLSSLHPAAFTLLTLLSAHPLDTSASQPTAITNLTPAQLYEMACATCHGPTGRLDPLSPRARDFQVIPADFTDPLFNSREPAEDWFLVLKHGGPALGLSSQMPSYADAFTDDQLRRLIAHVKDFAGDHGYPPGELNFFRPIRTKKAFPEDEVVLMTRYENQSGRSAWKNAAEFETRIGKRHQLSLELVQEIEEGNGQLTELEPGWKTALLYDLDPPYIVTAGASLSIPLQNDGLYTAVPFVAAATELSPTFTLQTSLRSHLPFEDFDTGDIEASAIVHWITTPWPRGLFPGLELTARVPFEPGPDDAVQLSLTPQLHAGLSKAGHVQMNVGVEIPLTRRTYDFRIHATVVWDWADGWFWERW